MLSLFFLNVYVAHIMFHSFLSFLTNIHNHVNIFTVIYILFCTQTFLIKCFHDMNNIFYIVHTYTAHCGPLPLITCTINSTWQVIITSHCSTSCICVLMGCGGTWELDFVNSECQVNLSCIFCTVWYFWLQNHLTSFQRDGSICLAWSITVAVLNLLFMADSFLHIYIWLFTYVCLVVVDLRFTILKYVEYLFHVFYQESSNIKKREIRGRVKQKCKLKDAITEKIYEKFDSILNIFIYFSLVMLIRPRK